MSIQFPKSEASAAENFFQAEPDLEPGNRAFGYRYLIETTALKHESLQRVTRSMLRNAEALYQRASDLGVWDANDFLYPGICQRQRDAALSAINAAKGIQN